MSRASDRAYDQIRNMILSGQLTAGAQIREEHLAEICGVSRTPVRDALRRLEAELFIRRNDSQRSFIADWSLEDLEDAFTLRGMLEGHAAVRAATRISDRQLEALQVENEALKVAVTRTIPDVQAFLEHNRRFHAIIVEASSSEKLESLLSRIVEQPVVWRTAQHYDRENLFRSYREHDEILAAFGRRDEIWAGSVMTGHIRRAFHSYADAHRTDAAAILSVVAE